MIAVVNRLVNRMRWLVISLVGANSTMIWVLAEFLKQTARLRSCIHSSSVKSTKNKGERPEKREKDKDIGG